MFFVSSSLLIDPVVLSTLPRHEVALLEPQRNLLLRALNAVGAVADVAANILKRERGISGKGHSTQPSGRRGRETKRPTMA